MRRLLALLVVAVLAFVVWLLTRDESKSLVARPPETSAATEITEANPVEVELSSPVELAQPARATVVSEPTPAAHDVEVEPSAPADFCEVRGRFTLPGGAPASSVALKIRGWGGNTDRVRKFGTPDAWTDPIGTTEADGSFSLRFEPPRAFQFILSAKLPGWSEASWRWSEIEPRATIDVGTIELSPAGSVRGRIVDDSGRVLSKGWTVYGQSIGGRQGADERQDVRVHAVVDQATGEFLLDGLPEGSVRLKANSRMANWIEGPLVEVRAGQVSTAEIPYTGPDNSKRITVTPFVSTFYVFSGDVDAITLTGPGIEPRTARMIEGSSQSFTFEDLPPGVYSVEVRDPRFLPWSQSGVEPGTNVDAKLRGCSSVALQVLDEQERPVARYALDVRLDDINYRPNTFRALDANGEAPAGGIVDGLIPHDQTLIVRVDGYPPCEVAVPGLAPGERRPVIARLARGYRITGRVVAGLDKSPCGGALVVLSPNGMRDSRFFRDHVEGVVETNTNAHGEFVFENLAAGQWTVRASSSPLVSLSNKVSITADAAPLELVLVLPQQGALSGKLIAPAGAEFEGLLVVATPRTQDEADAKRFRDLLAFADEDVLARVSSDGAFRTGPLPAGVVDVAVKLPAVRHATERGWSSFGAPSIELGEVTIAPGPDTVHTFDLKDHFPGTIGVRARVDGAAAARHVVSVRKVGSQEPVAAIELDAQGVGRSGPISPGTYEFMVRPLDSAWTDVPPVQHTLSAAQAIDVELDTQLVAAPLRVVDPVTGTPHGNCLVHLVTRGDPREVRAQGLTDAKGEVTLRAPGGHYDVVAGEMWFEKAEGGAAAIEWMKPNETLREVRVRRSDFPK